MRIVIREPFNKAWEIFRWSTRCLGVGIKQSQIDKLTEKDRSVEIYIKSINQSYLGKPSEIKKFATSNKWTYIVGKDTRLYVMPVDLLRKII